MCKSKLYKNLLLSNLDLEVQDPITRKTILLNILLYVGGLLLAFFTLYNFLIAHAYTVGMIDLLALLGAAYAVVDIRVTGKITKASYIATLGVFFLMLALVYLIEGEDFTLIWTIFLPIFAIFIKGSKKGLVISTFFYIILFYLAYKGLGVWEEGTWNTNAFIRLVAASIGLSFITYFFELSLENAYASLQESQELEKEYIKNLEICSITDPLTQLYNRRHLDTHFAKKFNKAKEQNQYFALFILDLDHFKEYNDTYGHKAGDLALQDIAKVLQSSMHEESDSTFRLGGEEFCGLCIADTKSKVIEITQNVCYSIKALSIEHVKSDTGVLTASFGLCTINSFEDMSLDKMYKIADDNLYLAKASGRDCVIFEESQAKL